MKRAHSFLENTNNNPTLSSNEGTANVINSESTSPRASIAQNNSQITVANEFLNQRLVTQSLEPWGQFIVNNSEGNILKVATINEVNQIQNLITNHPNQKLNTQIQVLDFGQLDVNSYTCIAIQTLLNTLTEDAEFSFNLISFKIGNLQDHITFTIPSSCINLINLEIGNLSYDSTWTFGYHPTTLKLPNSLDNLTNLKIGDIHDYAILELPKTMNNITTITIGNLDADATLNLPSVLPSLQNLSIGNLPCYSRVKLPISCDNLQTLTLGNIGTGIKLPTSLNNLISLTIGNVEANATLSSQAVQDYTHAIITLVNLDNLITLTFGNISNNAIINLPNLLNNLTTLIFGNINNGVNIQLPTGLANLQTITAQAIADTTVCNQLDSLSNGTNVRVNYYQSSCLIQ